jgi:hypothetical protein
MFMSIVDRNYVLLRKIEKNGMGGACSACGGSGEAYYKVLVGKPGRKRPLGRPRRSWEGNINPYPANVENMVSS